MTDLSMDALQTLLIDGPSSFNQSFVAAQPEASSVCSPKPLLDHTPRSIYFDVDSNYKYCSISRTESARDSFSLGGRTSLPPLFDSGTDSVRSIVKPGAALAVASAAAFKSRRALSANLHNQELAAKAVEGPRGSDVSNDGFNSIASETDRSNEKVVQEDVQWDNYQSAVVDVSDEFSAKEDNGESQEEPAQSSQFDKLRFSDSQKISTSSYIEPNVKSPIQPDENLDLEENATVSVSDDFPDGQVPSSSGDENNGVISEFVEASEITANGMVSSPGSSEGRSMENKMEIAMLEASELERVMPCSRDEVSLTGDDTSSRNDVIDLDVDIINQLESKRITKRTEKKSRSSVKPLELAEDLGKKHAYSGLDWENDIAAQPMRLEGIQRGSTALGYFDVDANNTITRIISTQAFRRDQGSPQVMAVHLNFIAVGMSKGVVLVIPSKYSSHCVDNMDAKGDNSHSAVTSMCFNQQGDLLFVGYSNGYVTVWDVLKGSTVKVVSGIHDAPVVHLLYLGQDSQVTRQFRVVSGDSKGLVWLITFSVVPWLNRFSFSTTCLLDGKTTGKVLRASPLLSDESCGGALMSSQGNATGSSGSIGSMM